MIIVLRFEVMYRVIVFLVGCVVLNTTLLAQYEPSPSQGMRWHSFSLGANSADYCSGNFSYSYNQRGESALTSIQWDFSQEMISIPNDSIAAFDNKTSAVSLMIGEAWRGKRIPWYASTGIGMSLNMRHYADFKPQSSVEWEKLTKFTMGIPVFADFGMYFGKSWGLGLHAYGNWNFRQAYAGVNIALVYRLKDLKVASE
jgi:hypothetical protein